MSTMPPACHPFSPAFFSQVPTWSANRRDHLVAAVRFLVFRFRLDSWWFGLPLLARGPLLSLPVVFATDYPPIQVIAIAMIMSGLLVTWKHRQDRTQLDIARVGCGQTVQTVNFCGKACNALLPEQRFNNLQTRIFLKCLFLHVSPE